MRRHGKYEMHKTAGRRYCIMSRHLYLTQILMSSLHSSGFQKKVDMRHESQCLLHEGYNVQKQFIYHLCIIHSGGKEVEIPVYV